MEGLCVWALVGRTDAVVVAAAAVVAVAEAAKGTVSTQKNSNVDLVLPGA